MYKNTKKGFTLIELLVVIAIIGILSSVVLASLNSARLKARDAKRVSDVKQLQLALEMYYDDNSAYPTALTVANLVTPGYISTIPTDPSGQTAYTYAALIVGSGTACSDYHIGATLESATNAVLNGDADSSGGTICTGSAAEFDGSGTESNGDSATTPIYDLKP